MIPQETIEQIAAASDVIDIIGGYLPLKQAGGAFKALCPFHQEKSPSFTVNPSRQSFKCFGCGKGGTVFKFVELYENISFPAAVRRLAEKAGIAIIEEGGYGGRGDNDQGVGETRRRLLALHAEAADWFHRNLRKSNEAAVAREYLKSRGLTSEIAARWKLGYAPNSYDACMSWASGRGYPQDLLILGGLVTPPDDDTGGHSFRRSARDKFRDRLMFPIYNDSGKGEVIGFSGRVLKSDTKAPKYVNSPETPIFTKGKILFGLHLSKRAILDETFAIVCEGQIDLITAYEAGIKNVVAPQGTAFTIKQAQLLKRQADEVVLCFDADNAGQQAAERSLPALLEANVTVRVATMPPGEDPDSLIRNHGVGAFADRIGMAQDFFDFQMERLRKMFDADTPKGKTQIARRLAESVVLITDNLLRETVVGKISAQLGVSAQAFTALLKPARPARRDADLPPDLTGASKTATGADEPPAFEKPPLAVAHLIRLALENPEAREWVLAQPWRQTLPKLHGAELLSAVLEAELDPADTPAVNAYLASLPSAEEAFLADLLDDKPFAQPMLVARHSWIGLEKSLLTDRLSVLINKMRAPGLTAEDATLLQKEILDLQSRLNDIARL